MENYKVRCTKIRSGETLFTVGKVYDVVNGTITDDTGYNFCPIGEDDGVEWLKKCEYEFERVDGKFKVGDRVVLTKDRDSAKKGMKGTIVADMKYGDWGVRFGEKFDGGHSLRGKCESGYGHWIAPEEMALIPKFEVGQIYRVEESVESGNIIRITKNEPGQLRELCYETIRGAEKISSRFGENSRFADFLTLLTGEEIGEAIRKYDAEHAEKGIGVKEVKRHAKVGEYIRVTEPKMAIGYKAGDVLLVRDTYSPVSVECKGVSICVCDSEYVVLEGYKPRQKEKNRKAKVGETVRAIRDQGGSIFAGKLYKVETVEANGTVYVKDPSGEYSGCTNAITQNNYVVVSSDRHSYTDAEAIRAKEFVLDTICKLAEKSTYVFFDRFGHGFDNFAAHVMAPGCCISEGDGQLIVEGAKTGESTCSDHDKPNEWIGKCVALCKALDKPIPGYITGDGKDRHFSLEKAKRLAYDDSKHEIGIHCKTQNEIDQLMQELEKIGYKWRCGQKPTESVSDCEYRFINDQSKTILKDTTPCGQPCVEFSDCFTED